MGALTDSFPKVSAAEAGVHIGKLLEQARHGPVTIVGHGEPFVLMRGEDYERQLGEHAADGSPRLTLDGLLAGYDRDHHRADWPDDAPRGKESL